MLRVSRKNSFDAIGAGAWNALLPLNAINEPFQTYEWNSCWWESARRNQELLLLVAEDGDALVGIAPLMIRSSGRGPMGHTVIEFIGTGESDYCDFIVSSDRKAAVLAAIFAFLRKEKINWDVLSLQHIPDRSDTVPVLERLLQELPYKVRRGKIIACPTLLIGEDPGFAEQCVRKKSLRRHFNYFNKAGLLAYEVLQSPDEIDACMDDFFVQHIERRAIADGSSKFDNPGIRDFYRLLVQQGMAAGWLRFARVTLDDFAIAYHFGFEYGGKFTWYKPTFNIDYIQKSPGEVLLKFLLEDAIEKGLDEFDFTIGDEGFKRRFANEIRHNLQLDVFRNKMLWAATGVAGGTKAFLKDRFPRAVELLKRLLNRDTWPVLYDLESRTWYRLGDNSLKRRSTGATLTVREGNISDARIFSARQTPDERQQLIVQWHRRLRSGDKVFVAMESDKPTSYAWMSADPDVVYEFRIMEDRDGQNGSAVALYGLVEQLQKMTEKSVAVAVSPSPANQKNMQSAGFEKTNKTTKLCLLGVHVSWQTAIGRQDK